ncbi:polysaccharide pyruvyl transferase family protein [Vibrio sp. 10N.222.49.C12]|uniref:polysaccharide pyruvyl transferase family protein n=1 Tax=Vibrio sp. 10N.222.49.C12 TaxID=3229614 RepID=UPI00354D268E
MKIAILTLPLWNNYGGILQCLAMCKKLEEYGHEVILLNYHHKPVRRHVEYIRIIKRKIRKLITGSGCKVYPNRVQREIISQNTLEFIKNNFSLISPEFHTSAELSKYLTDNLIETVVVGSDQVWRPSYTPNIYTYFLDFVPDDVIRIAYAPSFGTDKVLYSERMITECKKLIDRLDLVTVREISGKSLLKKMFNINADVVVDPTLLHKKDMYTDLVHDVPCQNKGDIFCYVLDRTEDISNQICNAEKGLGKKSFEIMPKTFDEKFNTSDITYKFPPIESWVAAFRDSDYIITDSFHGCVFSIIFNKPFVAIGNHERGMSRFESLLKQFGLEDRLVVSKTDSLSHVLTRSINWTSVNAKRDELCLNSLDLLLEGLKVER